MKKDRIGIELRLVGWDKLSDAARAECIAAVREWIDGVDTFRDGYAHNATFTHMFPKPKA